MTKRINYEEVQSYLKLNGVILLSNNYINALTPLECQCYCGYHFHISLNNFKKGRRCPKCSYKRLSDENRLSIVEVRNIFKSQGYTLQSDYINSRNMVEYVCPNGHVGKTSLANFKRGSRCNLCRKGKMKMEQHLGKILTKELAIRLYIEEKKSVAEIAKLYNASFGAVDDWIHRRYRLRRPKLHEIIDKDSLSDLLYSQKLSQRKIAQKYNVTKNSIKNLMTRYGLESRPIEETRHRPLEDSVSIKEIIDLYANQNYSIERIAERCGGSYSGIRGILTRNGVTLRTIEESIKVNKENPTVYLKDGNSLAEKFPEIAKQLHPTLNGNLNADEINYGSGFELWWQCEKHESHVWKTTVHGRTSGRNCPFCSGKQVNDSNCLATVNPQVAEDWHPTLNGEFTPHNVTIGSSQKAWWLCRKGHKWRTSILHRVHGTGCPKCNRENNTSFGEQMIAFYISQVFPATENPYFVKNQKELFEVDIYIPELNIGIEYDGFHHKERTEHDEKKNRILQEKGIQLIRVRDSKLPIIIPYGSKVVHYDKNNELASLLKIGEFFRPLSSAIQRSAIDNWQRIELEKDRIKIYERFIEKEKKTSIGNMKPELIKEWHPTKNGRLTPFHIRFGSKKVVWWYRKECGHEWDAPVNKRFKGHQCPYCRGLRVDESNSFAVKRPDLMKQWYWEKNINVNPNEIPEFSHDRVWWKCEKFDDHIWEAKITDRSAVKTVNCPFCLNKKVALSNCLATTNKDLAAQWHPTLNGELTPFQVNNGYGKDVWWLCNNNHEWQDIPRHRKKRPKCPHC